MHVIMIFTYIIHNISLNRAIFRLDIAIYKLSRYLDIQVRRIQLMFHEKYIQVSKDMLTFINVLIFKCTKMALYLTIRQNKEYWFHLFIWKVNICLNIQRLVYFLKISHLHTIFASTQISFPFFQKVSIFKIYPIHSNYNISGPTLKRYLYVIMIYGVYANMEYHRRYFKFRK